MSVLYGNGDIPYPGIIENKIDPTSIDDLIADLELFLDLPFIHESTKMKLEAAILYLSRLRTENN